MHSGKAILSAVALLGLVSPAGAQLSSPPPPRPPYNSAPVAVPPPPSGVTPAMPTGNPGEWVTSNDYPTKALREEAAGVTAFRLTIGTGGMVAGCAITASSGSQELDDATCQLITQRALFSPARNANGEPVTGQYSNRVRWVLPASSSPNASVQLANLNRVVTFFVETDGTVTQCRITVDGVDYSARSDSFCKTQRHYAPFRDALGNPVRRKVTITSIARITDPDGKPRPPRMKRRR